MNQGSTKPLAVALMLAASAGARAQVPEPQAGAAPAAPAESALEDIVVTAQKRTESLQDVPIAVSATSGSALVQGGVQNTNDLQFKTPSLVVTTNGAFGQPFLRGVGTDILGIGTESSVALNIDGVYIARPTSAIQDFYDVDRVEVVKGPQGILYGRNATGGAINIITAQPAFDFGGSADFTYGNYNKVRATGVLNVPLSDKVAVRVSFVRSSHDGYSQRIFEPDRPTDLDDENVYGGRLQLRFRPDEDWDVTLAADYFRQKDAAFLHNRPISRAEFLAAGLPLNDTFLNSVTGAASETPLPGFTRRAGAISRTPAESFGGVVPDDPRQLTHDIAPFNSVKDYGFRGTVVRSGDAVTFKSITSYRANLYSARQDFDGTNAQFFLDREGTTSRVFSQELQLTSASRGPFQWIAGLYYFHETGSSFFDYELGNAPAGLQGAGYVNVGLPRGSIKTDAAAAYGQASVEVTPGLTATAGLRYSYERKHDFTLVDPSTPNVPTCDPRPLRSAQRSCATTFKVLTPKFGLEYRVDDGPLVFVSATRGFKSGGFNSNGAGESFAPEYIWSYEAGLKAEWFDRRLRTNLAAFWYDYSDLQVRLRDPLRGAGQVVSNAARARIRGVELDAQAAVTGRLTLDVSAAYLEAKFRGYRTVNGDEAPDVVLDLSGNTLPRAPRWTLSSGFNYLVPVASGSVTVSGDWRYSSRMYFDVFNQPFVQQAPFSLFNARIQYENDKHRWNVAAFVRNIANKQYATSILRSDGVVGTLEFLGAPRTYGVMTGVKF